MVRIRQGFRTKPIQNIPNAVRSALAEINLQNIFYPGDSVAITAGSRGIANIVTVLKEIINALKEIRSHPFIVPAMGSHGGATAEGQKKVLEHYGITEETLGVPIKSSMEVVPIGTTSDGLPVL